MGRRIASTERPASSAASSRPSSSSTYLSPPALRTRIRRGLLKGEQLHALARCVHYGRLGRLDQRDFERQTGAASCLLRILAAIIHWQIREIDRVLSEAGSDADDLNFELLSHISPIGWDNVLLCAQVADALHVCGLGPESLRELFDTLRVIGPSEVKAKMEALRVLGVRMDMQERSQLN